MSSIEEILNLEDVSVTSNGIKAKCPFAKWTHKNGVDNRPSFEINNVNGVNLFGCRSCGTTGKLDNIAQTFLQVTGDSKYLFDLVDVDWSDLMKEFKPLEKTDMVLRAKLYDRILPRASLHRKAIDYCASRNITRETMDRIDLRYHPEFERVIFTIYNQRGQLLGHSGRSIKKDDNLRMWTTPNSAIKKTLLGIHKLNKRKPIILAEGLFFYTLLHEYGLDKDYNILSSMGASVTKPQREVLISLGMPLYLLLDNDTAGIRAVHEGTKKLPALKHLAFYGLPTYVVRYPEDEDGNPVEDPDYLTKDQVYAIIDNAKLVNTKGAID
ncbi:toprim domain-containing protein [Cognatishimia sp.]|uniref:toprim domain-containing protein n=1 Tax=Cognatishimia sp. TaxID=2211648 RepID=UPI0035172F10|nr:hypothetical protein [Cognatishimia sp.]